MVAGIFTLSPFRPIHQIAFDVLEMCISLNYFFFIFTSACAYCENFNVQTANNEGNKKPMRH